MNTTTLIHKGLLILFGLITLSYTTLSAQEDSKSEFSYQINRVQKYVSISPAELNEATTLSDLNHFYKEDWVKEYKSIKMTAISNGQKKTVDSANEKLTTAQKELILSADLNSDIYVLVNYLPDNNFSNTKVQEMDFSFRIDPEKNAEYVGGEDELDQYITKYILKNVCKTDVPQYQVAAVKFTIDKEGHVVDAHVAQASKNEDTDKLILKTICDMPKWESAHYADGSKTKQEFVFTIGDPYSCTMNTLDIKSEAPPSTLAKK